MTSGSNIFSGTFPQLVAVLAGTLTAISDGMLYGWTAPAIPVLLKGEGTPLKITEYQGEWLENFLMIGSFCGLPQTVYLVDKIGRKKSILLSSFTTMIVWIVIAIAPRIEYLFVVRAIAGAAGNMAFVATPMYIAEIADQKIRGFLSSLIYLTMLFGVLLVYSIVPYTPYYVHCVVGGGLTFLQLVIFPFMPESPYYLIFKDRPLEARKSLERLRPKDANIDREIREITKSIERQKNEKGRPQDLFLVRSNRKAITIMALLNWSQHFSSISVMLMNLHLILEAAGSIYITQSLAGIVFSVFLVGAAVIATFLMDKFGRKFLLISSSLLSGMSLFTLAVFFTLKHAGHDVSGISWIPVVSVMLYACFFKLGLGMVPIVLTAELFPARLKALGVTFSDTFYVVSSLLSLQIYQYMKSHFGWEYPFYIFAMSCLIAAIFTYFYVPETKGRSLEEIQFILKGNKDKNFIETQEQNEQHTQNTTT